MTGLLLTLAAQTEELWSVPVRSGDQLGDFSERPIALSPVQHSPVEHPDLVSDAVPVTHQDTTRRGWCSRRKSQRPSRARVLGEVNEESSSGGFEPTVDLLLN